MEDAIIRDYKSGLSFAAVGYLNDVNVTTVRMILSKAGVQSHRDKAAQQKQYNRMKILYEAGKPMSHIAAMFGITRAAVAYARNQNWKVKPAFGLSASDNVKIVHLLQEGLSNTEIAKRTGFSVITIEIRRVRFERETSK